MPGLIPIGQAPTLYTTGLQARFDELKSIKVYDFCRSFFREVLSKVQYPAWEVRRATQLVGFDVMVGHQGRRTQITKSTVKAVDPFYYKYYFDATQLECYFRVFGSDSFNMNDMTEMVNGVAVEQKEHKDLIDRGIELFCASIMETGTATSLDTGAIIDFGRKPESMVDPGAGNYWTTDGTDPFADLRAGCDFLVTEGAAGGGIINAIFGIEAWTAFRENSTVKEHLKQFNNRRDILLPSQIGANGQIYQGSFDCDSYIIQAWTYNQFYKLTEDGEFLPYKNPKTVVLIPDSLEATCFYGATPQVVMPGTATSSLVTGKYVIRDFANAEMGYHRFYTESRPMPVPISVDRMWTFTAVAPAA